MKCITWLTRVKDSHELWTLSQYIIFITMLIALDFALDILLFWCYENDLFNKNLSGVVGQSTIDTSREKLHWSRISGGTSWKLEVTLFHWIYFRPLSLVYLALVWSLGAPAAYGLMYLIQWIMWVPYGIHLTQWIIWSLRLRMQAVMSPETVINVG